MQNEMTITDEEVEFDELLMRFLRNELSEDEERGFLKVLEDDPGRKAHAVAVARLIKGIRQHAKAEDDEIAAALRAKKHPNAIRLALSILAAAVVVGLGIFIFNKYQEHELNRQLAVELTARTSLPEIVRGDDDGVLSELQALFDNVEKSENLDETAARLDEIWHEVITLPYATQYTDYASQIAINLVAAHLKNNDRRQALEVLGQVVEVYDEDSPVAEVAKNIINKLKN